MRRWACVFWLLLGFAGDGALYASRSPVPVPIERPLGPPRAGRLERAPAWWQAS